MPSELLNRLCNTRLPEEIASPLDIGKVQLLRSLGLTEADVPYAPPDRAGHSTAGNAIVMGVTLQGRAAAGKGTRALPFRVVVRTVRHQSVPSSFP
jgi:hypothetical protein